MKSPRFATALLAALLTMTGCSYSDTRVPEYKPPPDAKATPASCTTSAEDLRSYEPSRTAGKTIERIRNAGVLKVGVSGDTLLLGSRNPSSNQIEGFDIDIAQRIADELGVKLQKRVINAGDRITLLQLGQIDIVARNMTINCDRWSKIAFSAEYYRAGQKVMLRSDLADSYRGPADLADVTVCAPGGTTSVENIRDIQPNAKIVTAANHTGCLVKFQQGEVKAITGDDTVLAGLVAQDQYYAAVPRQEPLTDAGEPYGIGANIKAKDLVAFVNAVLEEMRSDGSWKASYDRWLKPYLKVDAAQPRPTYGRQ